MRLIFPAILRILLGLALLASAALPATIIVKENNTLKEVMRGIDELAGFLGNQASARLLAGFLVCVPLLGLYIVIETIVMWRRRNRIQHLP